MKKYILLLMMTSGLAACTESFLDEEMVAVITQDYFNTEQGLEELIVGTYDTYRVSKQYERGPKTFLYGLDYITPADVNYAKYAGSSWNSSSAHAAVSPYNLSGEFNSSTLMGYYPIINNCNRAILTIENGEALGKFAADREYADLRKAEAMLNRAYCIYILNTMYGDVYIPRGYTKALPASFDYRRETSESLYRQIIGDLRFAFEHLPDVSELNLATDFGRGTKQIAAHFLAKLYLQRAQAARYGTAEYGRQADGSIDRNHDKAYLGLLYKGAVATDVDSCIYFATELINHGYHRLEPDYRTLYTHKLGDYAEESSPELILSCVYGKLSANNGRYGNRLTNFIGGKYSNANWGIPTSTWEKGKEVATFSFYLNDFGCDLFVNKLADSRFEKSFYIEHSAALRGGETNIPGPDADYYAYNSADNKTYAWTEDMADYFNANILPAYDRASWGGREAKAGEHKIGKGDIAYAIVENTRATAIDINEALAQPFVLFARWMKDDAGKYYYRLTHIADGKSYKYDLKSYTGLDKPNSTIQPHTRKYADPNRTAKVTDGYDTRDIPIFRLAETYLLRAEAYGRKQQWGLALADINMVRERAAYKSGESRAEVLARLQPGSENLDDSERRWPYSVSEDTRQAMRVDESYWDGSSDNSRAESFPPSATSTEDRFVNFILNELAREFSYEMHYYENLHHSGWQAERIIYNNQMASNLSGRWGAAADNLLNGLGQNGNGQGGFQPYHTFKPFTQTLLNMLTDANGNLLDDAAKQAYQNPGY